MDSTSTHNRHVVVIFTKEAANHDDKEVEMAAEKAAKEKRQLIRGKRKCKRCGELGHGKTNRKKR